MYHDWAAGHIPELVRLVISRRRDFPTLVTQGSLTTARRTFPNVDAQGIFPIAGKEGVTRICGIGEAMRDLEAEKPAAANTQDVPPLDVLTFSLPDLQRSVYRQSLGSYHSESPSIYSDTSVYRV